MKYEIIVFSDEWNGLPFSCKHLLSHFIPDKTLIWVETIGLRSPRLNLYDVKRSIGRIKEWLNPQPKEEDPGLEELFILNPFQIPYNQFPFIRKVNKRFMTLTLGRFYKNHQGRAGYERVLITTWPFTGNIVGCLDERLSIYYRVDDYSEFPGVCKGVIRRLEEELMRKVDMVVATSESLAQTGERSKEVKYLPHGVNFEHFSQKFSGHKKDLPVQSIPSPRIGFFGLIDSWVDFDLLAQVAEKHHEWSFVFIGPSQIPISSLPRLHNMHFLGPVSYKELPRHAQHFDVGLIPFKVNELTKSVNPLKLMEYFSIGFPVVSTPLPEVTKYRDHLFIASGPDAFCAAIQSALGQESQNGRDLRQDIARSHSWKHKSLTLRGWIEEALGKKQDASN
ncbi:MAG: glycosyltransferase [bacterium]